MKLRTILFLLALPLACVRGAEYEAGPALLAGKNTASDPIAARAAFEKGASLGQVLAKLQLGILCSNGTGGPRDDARALSLFSEAAAAGQREALYNKGLFLLLGRGGPRDLDAALTTLAESAAAGSVHAHVKLADLFYFGTEGLKQDRTRALPHVKAAAEAGDAWACNILGTMAEYGYAMPMDRGIALHWFMIAAGKNNAKAQANLGRMLRADKPTPADQVQAYMWLRLAAEQGDPAAKILLADHVLGLSPAQRSEGDGMISEFRNRLDIKAGER
ncbi:MAG: tetratricopeptide repeat protein [Verrucomicrobiota bacterium]